MDLLEEACHCEVDFEVSDMLKQCPEAVHFLLPVDQVVELSGPAPAPCLPAHRFVSSQDDYEVNLRNHKPALIKYYLYKSC